MTLSVNDARLANLSTGKYLTRALNIDPPARRLMPGVHVYKDHSERLRGGLDCDEVYPGILVGDGPTMKNLKYLQKLGVTHVLNAAENDVNVSPQKLSKEGIRYFGFRCPDLPQADMASHLDAAVDFIDLALSFSFGKVYVGCLLGYSRSAVVVAAYLMKKKGLTATQALSIMRETREVRPNVGFLHQLGKMDDQLRKERYRY